LEYPLMVYSCAGLLEQLFDIFLRFDDVVCSSCDKEATIKVNRLRTNAVEY